MNLASLSIKRPVFITCIVIAMLASGAMSFMKLGVDLFPNVTFPFISVWTIYPGAGPKEIETQVSKIIEEQIATIPGLKSVGSVNQEGLSVVSAEFTLETDVKFAEQQVKDKIALVRRNLPDGVEEPLLRRIDPSEQPVAIIAVQADMPETQLFDLADRVIRPMFEQIQHVGLVEVLGGRKREIHVLLDRQKMKARELSVNLVAQRLGASGLNIPAGKVIEGGKEIVYRTLGEYRSLDEIGKTVVNFLGNEVPVQVRDVAQVTDNMKDETTRTFFNGKQAIFLNVYRQSGSNTVDVVDNVIRKMEKLAVTLKTQPGAPQVELVRDGSKLIRANIADVYESIIIGIILTIIVVYFFLANGRSTIITGLALPNSLLGAFILMAIFGFTINIMTLLALSLSVGLLVDDAIVVRENIFRHIELGASPIEAAIKGTSEVTLAVIATTLAVIAVFGPIAFLQGIVGQFLKEFGLTICFAMAISLFDALTIAPMLSAYLAGSSHGAVKKGLAYYTTGVLLRAFGRFQDWLEHLYEGLLKQVIRLPWLFIALAVAVFLGCMSLFPYISKTFLTPQDFGEFLITLDTPPGTSLDEMSKLALEVEGTVRNYSEVRRTAMTVGKNSKSNFAEYYVELVPRKERNINTSEFKDELRRTLQKYKSANPIVKDIDLIAAGMRPFNVNIEGANLEEIEGIAQELFRRIKDHPALQDVDINYRPGKPEVQVHIDQKRAERLGVLVNSVGAELRGQIEGVTPAVFRVDGEEYDIRLRMREDQRNLKEEWSRIFVPNMNFSNVRLSDFARYEEAEGPSTINRRNRMRYIQLNADINPSGAGLDAAMKETARILQEEMKIPSHIGFKFVGQGESYQEMKENMIVAMSLGVLFIYLVLASLYESFVTPFTIMLVLPLAICGAVAGLYVCSKSLDLFSMIGCILLLGVAIKNSILLVDFANHKVQEGMSRNEAMILAGKTRLRPILMTTFALIAGMLPIAIGLNEASAQRTSMGVAIIGGLISSTLLTLIVIPAAYSYVDRFRVWSLEVMKKLFMAK
ncbi:efflux RND transporter permease subunit [Oligoflexus tunisiensis]|uniref:efflux RND transporter permease subunit n=1 Tax=Oligoflexus tunisiensis TaxID=708132 RepID=UPI000A9C13A4|nr:efflux RND transporter permease subunit [Oligoflexus tunisiensis]